jgi:hypothetical protein
VLINDLLHALARCSPRLISDKAKIHLLVHMPLFVRRHGPLLGSNTERYESFNSTFRQCSILSNGFAPSRDIARTFCTFDRTKHIASGGYYYDPATRTYIQGGSGILEMMQHSRLISRLFALETHMAKSVPGMQYLLVVTSHILIYVLRSCCCSPEGLSSPVGSYEILYGTISSTSCSGMHFGSGHQWYSPEW